MDDLATSVAKLNQFAYKLQSGDQSFAYSLIDQFGKKKFLSERQIPHVERLLAKACPTEAAINNAPVVANFNKIVEVFETAHKNKHKKPVIRFGSKDYKIKLSEASERSQNYGSIYVTLNDDYMGKIDAKGKLSGKGSSDSKLLQNLGEFSMDPLTQMKKYGKATGTCSCCGRKLTDPVSIKNGIGPICQEGFGY